MRRDRYRPRLESFEKIVLCDGAPDGLGPPPEVEANPPGGVLDDPGMFDDPGLPPSTWPIPMDPADPFA